MFDALSKSPGRTSTNNFVSKPRVLRRLSPSCSRRDRPDERSDGGFAGFLQGVSGTLKMDAAEVTRTKEIARKTTEQQRPVCNWGRAELAAQERGEKVLMKAGYHSVSDRLSPARA